MTPSFDFVKRVWEYETDGLNGFTRRYGVHRLACPVYTKKYSRVADKTASALVIGL